jgi:DUF971 family protein
MELVGEQSNLYDWEYCSYTKKKNVDILWENISKELNESGQLILC